jgi:acetoin utilization deacetylase AcuC-like enzyme
VTEEIGEVEGLGSIPHGYYERAEPLTGVVIQPGMERHDPGGGTPENIRRLRGVMDHLRAAPEWERLFVLYPRYAQTEDLLRSHDAGFVDLLERIPEHAPVWLDTDTRVSRDSFDVAKLAAGATLAGVDAVAMEAYHRPDSLFAIVRPPGHHAGPGKAMGVCVLNNVSIAARYAQSQYGFERVAILDWDVHHGNGTQEIHWDDPSVLYVSLHQWPLYPGTGWLDEIGGPGAEGATVNVPLPAGSGDAEYLEALDAVALPAIEAFSPQLLLVSAGQDASAADPLSNQLVSRAGFRAMSARVAELARRLRIGLLVVHEGGYNVSTLPAVDRAILAGLGDFEVPLDDIFVPAGAQPPVDWPERLAQVLAAQPG